MILYSTNKVAIKMYNVNQLDSQVGVKIVTGQNLKVVFTVLQREVGKILSTVLFGNWVKITGKFYIIFNHFNGA